MFQNKYGIIFLILLSSFTGGFISNTMFAHAQDYNQVISAKAFQLVNNDGKIIGTWATCSANLPCLNFYDANNKVRLQMGVGSYEVPGGLPFIGLFDEKFRAKGLLRLYGQAEAPVLVMKNNDQDKLIMGLDFQDSTDPFMVSFDKNGGQHTQFGQYGSK